MFMHPAGDKSFENWEGVKKKGIVTQNKPRNTTPSLFFFNNKLKMRMVKQHLWCGGQQKRNGYLEFRHHKPYFVYSV